jgi:predicted DNA-binding transcriptional regulator AlpA
MSKFSLPFLLPSEVDELTRLSDLTRRRLEEAGKFPRRIKIANRKIAWRRADILLWLDDPPGWAKRDVPAAAEPKAVG